MRLNPEDKEFAELDARRGRMEHDRIPPWLSGPTPASQPQLNAPHLYKVPTLPRGTTTYRPIPPGPTAGFGRYSECER